MKSFTKEDKFPVILLVALMAIIIAYGAIFNSIGYSAGVLGVALLVAICLLVNLEQCYFLIVFCFPFARILKLSVASFSITPILCAIIIVKLLVLKRQKLKTVPLICFLFFAVMQFLSVIIYEASLTGIISFLLSTFFVLYSASFLSSDNNCSKTMTKNAGLFLAIAVALSVILCDMFPNIMSLISIDKFEELEYANRFGALFIEPNEFSQIVLVAIGFLIATFSSYKTLVGKIVVILLALYLGSCGLRSNSKSYVLTLFGLLGVLMVIYVVRFFKRKKTLASVLGFSAMLILGVFAGYYLIFNVIIPVFEMRGESADLLTGRDVIWGIYIDAILQRADVVMIGCGAGNVTGVLKLVKMYRSVVPHNVYLEYLIQFGITGITLLLLSWSEAFRSMRHKSVWLWIPALAFLVTSIGISANSSDCIFIVMVLLCMPLKLSSNVKSIG